MTLPHPKLFAATMRPPSFIIRRPNDGTPLSLDCSAISASPLFACRIIRNASALSRKSWQAIPLTPRRAPCWAPPILAGYTWAASLSRLGELTQATQILQEYEKSDLSPDAILLVGQLWTDMADYARAVASFLRALDRDPSLARAHYFAGLAQLRWDHTNEALEEFNAALKLTPDDPDAKIGLGYVYLQQNKQTEAKDIFRSVIATHPENGNAHYQLGKLLLNAGNVQEAVTELEAAARALPQTDYVHYQLQAAYRKESRTAEADRELQVYKELKAKNRQLTVPRPMERP